MNPYRGPKRPQNSWTVTNLLGVVDVVLNAFGETALGDRTKLDISVVSHKDRREIADKLRTWLEKQEEWPCLSNPVAPKTGDKDCMVFLPQPPGAERRSFRCDCGCNVFRHPLDEDGKEIDLKYVCNACGEQWVGEKAGA